MNDSSPFAAATTLKATNPWSKIDWVWLGLLASLLVGSTILLWPEWLHNPDLSHGLLTPFVFVILLREARRSSFTSFPGSRLGACLVGASGALGVLLFFGAALYAAALEWTHSVVEFLLLSAVGVFLVGGAITAALPPLRRLAFNWATVVAVLIWPLSAPIPPGTYTRLTLHLQANITDAVLFCLHLLGITAGRVGNVITLAHVEVGVEEACSGVRSLLSCVFAALFLSAVLVRGPWKRAILIAASVPLALGMNFLRSLTLTLLANADVEIQGAWHDATGYAILVLTALLLIALARVLSRLGKSVGPTTDTAASVSNRPIRKFDGQFRRAWLTASLGATALIWAVFTMKTRSTAPSLAPPSDLATLLPDHAEGWGVSTRDDLYRFSSQLQTNALFERTYSRVEPKGALQITAYLAYWPAGQASVSLVESHTPDACWPGSGWVENQSAHRRLPLRVGNETLPAADFRTFQLEGYPQNVWYWHLFNGTVIETGSANSPRALLSLAWNYGFRKNGEQVFVRISSNRPWEEIAREPLMKDIFQRLKKIGL